MSRRIRVLIIDDHPLSRKGIATVISQASGYTVVGEAGSGKEGVAMATRLKPDVAVTDITLPDSDGVDVVRNLRDRLPCVGIMVVTMHSHVDMVTACFEAGATGYVVKHSPTDTLLEGLESVRLGERYLDGSISRDVLSALLDTRSNRGADAKPAYADITPREREVMGLVAEGFTSREISGKLYISPRTVENHRCRIMRKLGVQSPVEMVRCAARMGLIDLDRWVQ